MALKALRLDAQREYISRFDPARADPAEATVFQLGALDARIYGRIKDKATGYKADFTRPDDEVETFMRGNDVAFETVQYGLRGWRNFRDEAGNDVPFKTVKRTHGGQSYVVADPELLKLLPQAVILELSGQINSDNEVSVTQRGN